MSAASSSDCVRSEDRNGIRILTIDRPDSRNALDVESRTKIVEIARDTRDRPDVRALVITGAHGTFCSGADIKGMQEYSDIAAARARVEDAQEVTRSITGAGVPTVAAVEGVAFGAGLGLAVACDVVVCGEDARFSAGFTRIGLGADFGVLYNLPQRVGPGRARRMMLLSDEVTGPTALGWGLADAMVASGEALSKALELAERLTAVSPRAVSAVRQAFADLPDTLAAALEAEVDLQSDLLCSPDYKEAVARFGQRRT